CEDFLARAGESGTLAAQAKLSGVRATIGLRTGDMAAAQRYAEDGLARLSAQGWGVAIGLPLATLVYAAAARRDREAAGKILQHPVPDAMRLTRFYLHYLHARGRFYAEFGYLNAALRDFETVGELARSWGVDEPSVVPWRSDAAEIHLRRGDVAAA